MSFNRKELRKYREAVNWLNNHHTNFLTEVLNIGRPRMDPSVPTAGIELLENKSNRDDGYFGFCFNPDFFDSLNVLELATVLAHETMHVLLDHLWMVHPTSPFRVFDRPIAFNLAADAIINDFLHTNGYIIPDNAVNGMDLVGYDCTYESIHDVYRDLIENSDDMLKEMEQEFTLIDCHDWLEDEESKKMMGQAIKKIEANINNGKLLKDALPDDMKALKEMSQYDGNGVDPDATSGVKQSHNGVNISGKWIELLKKIDPDIVHRRGLGNRELSSFRTPRRKIAHMYPDVILPIMEDPVGDLGRSSKRKLIVLALDVSGSIQSSVANSFIAIGASLPKEKVDVIACTFQTDYDEIDLLNPSWHGGGGTDFDAIQRFIKEHAESKIGHYPHSVIVVTDGEANFHRHTPTEGEKKSWTWLLSSGSDPWTDAQNHCKQYLKSEFSDNQVMKLGDFIVR